MKVGETVRVTNRSSSFFNQTGEITELAGFGCLVKLPKNEPLYFRREELEDNENPS